MIPLGRLGFQSTGPRCDDGNRSLEGRLEILIAVGHLTTVIPLRSTASPMWSLAQCYYIEEYTLVLPSPIRPQKFMLATSFFQWIYTPGGNIFLLGDCGGNTVIPAAKVLHRQHFFRGKLLNTPGSFPQQLSQQQYIFFGDSRSENGHYCNKNSRRQHLVFGERYLNTPGTIPPSLRRPPPSFRVRLSKKYRHSIDTTNRNLLPPENPSPPTTHTHLRTHTSLNSQIHFPTTNQPIKPPQQETSTSRNPPHSLPSRQCFECFEGNFSVRQTRWIKSR